MLGTLEIPVSPPIASCVGQVEVSGSCKCDVVGLVGATVSPVGRGGFGHHLGCVSPAKRLRVVSRGSDCHMGRMEVDVELEDTDSDTEPSACHVWNRLRKG